MATTEPTGPLLTPVLNNKIMSLYARGFNSAEIQDLLRNAYQMSMPQSWLRSTTDSVLGDYRAWQESALESQYPIVYFDSLAVRSRGGKDHRNHRVLFALAIDMQGQKCPLGIWVTANEGRQAWQLVMSDLKQRGVDDIFNACLYAQPGAREAISKAFPQTAVLLCVARLVENSLNLVAWKDRKKAAAALRVVYTSDNAEIAADVMTRFMCGCDEHYPAISQLWHAHWDQLIGLFKLPASLRDVIYSTIAISSLRQSLTKVSKRHGVFTDEDDLLVRAYLAQQNLARRWNSPLRQWRQVLNCLAVTYENRLQIKF